MKEKETDRRVCHTEKDDATDQGCEREIGGVGEFVT